MPTEERRTTALTAGGTDILDSPDTTNQLAAVASLTIQPSENFSRTFIWKDGASPTPVVRDLTSNPNVSEARMRIFHNKSRQQLDNWNSNAYNASTNPGGDRIDLSNKATGKITVVLTSAQAEIDALGFESAQYALEVKTGSTWIRLLEGTIRASSGT